MTFKGNKRLLQVSEELTTDKEFHTSLYILSYIKFYVSLYIMHFKSFDSYNMEQTPFIS